MMTTATGVGGGGGMPPLGCVTVDNINTKCHPVTQAGCNTAGGEACDANYQSMGFECYGPPNTLKKDATCPSNNGEYCEPGLHCSADVSQCKQYCCSNADCTMGGTCTINNMASTPFFSWAPMLGVCI